jgi:hypothetical protein
VVRAEAVILTTLLPIKIVVKRRSEALKREATRRLTRLFSPSRVRIWTKERLVKAVSAAEKKADKRINIMMITMWSAMASFLKRRSLS